MVGVVNHMCFWGQCAMNRGLGLGLVVGLLGRFRSLLNVRILRYYLAV